MKRFLLGILTAVMTLAVILGAGFVLAEREKEKEFLRMKMLEMYSNTLVNNLASAGEL